MYIKDMNELLLWFMLKDWWSQEWEGKPHSNLFSGTSPAGRVCVS